MERAPQSPQLTQSDRPPFFVCLLAGVHVSVDTFTDEALSNLDYSVVPVAPEQSAFATGGFVNSTE